MPTYVLIKKYLNQTLEKEGKKPLKDFYLIDISLLNLDGYFQIKEEQEFFKKYPYDTTSTIILWENRFIRFKS